MLARAQRLLENRDFQALFARGLYLSTPLYTLRWRKTDKPPSRFGFVVSNKISKKATERNAVRRRLREGVRKHKETLQMSVDAAFIIKQQALHTPFADIEREIERSFGVMNRPQHQRFETRRPARHPRTVRPSAQKTARRTPV